MKINMDVVSALINTSQGYSQLKEFTATLNMLNMCNRTYQEIHDDIYLHVNSIALN